RDLVNVLVVEAGARLDGRPLERCEVQHVARAVALARLGVDQHPVVVAVQALALRLGEAHLMRGAEPELLGDPIHGQGYYAASSSLRKNPQRTRICLPLISRRPRLVNSLSARLTVSREVPL